MSAFSWRPTVGRVDLELQLGLPIPKLGGFAGNRILVDLLQKTEIEQPVLLGDHLRQLTFQVHLLLA